MSEPNEEILQRLSRLESEVARIASVLAASEATREATPASPPRPPAQVPGPVAPPLARPVPKPAARAPKPPAKPRNPVVFVAAAGAGIFLLGAIFFLHLAIQRGWIGPEMRFLLGLMVGLSLSGWAARMILGEDRRLGACLLLAGLGTLVFSLRVGAFSYQFFPAALGLAGTAMTTLAAGALAARARYSPVLVLALVVGLAAPLLFSQGGHHEVALSVYLAVLSAAALAVPYLAGVGAGWSVARWVLLAGTWILLSGCCFGVLAGDAPVLLALLLLHLGLSALWIWIPGSPEQPSTPVVAWFLLQIAFASLLWMLWLELGWVREGFAAPVLLLAGVNLVLVKPIRARLGGRRGDLGQLVLTGGFLALAVPVALAWAWVGPLWGVFALALAWAVGYAQAHSEWEAEVRALRLLAIAMALLATGVWMVHEELASAAFPPGGHLPFLNRHFAEGMLSALAWMLLIRDAWPFSRGLGFLGVQIVGALTLAFELAHLVRFCGGSHRAASITMTLIWALLGAGQWLRSLTLEAGPRRPIALAGYAWLAVAGFKLIASDLASADMLLRALAFLGVGAVFLAAALVANQVRQGQERQDQERQDQMPQDRGEGA